MYVFLDGKFDAFNIARLMKQNRPELLSTTEEIIFLYELIEYMSNTTVEASIKSTTSSCFSRNTSATNRKKVQIHNNCVTNYRLIVSMEQE